MVTFSPVLIGLTALTVLAFGAFVVFSLQVHRAKSSELKWRGIVKLISLHGAPANLAAIYNRWFAAFGTFFLLTCLSVGYGVWGTDHSFLIVIFPLLFYYFFARFFLWEKADLTD
ncbi:MAG: hypothetical protein J0L53_12845 [Spirochaetes bacterium]|nr:hypothetical protein [Spirochaetota bacterium]